MYARRKGPLMVTSRAAEQADHALAFAVEAAPETNELEFLRDRLREPESGLDRLGAAREQLQVGYAFGNSEATRLRKVARFSVVKLPKVDRSSCSLRRFT